MRGFEISKRSGTFRDKIHATPSCPRRASAHPMQRIAILYDLSQAVMSTFDLDEVLNRTLAIMRDYFQMPNSSIFLIDSHTKELYLRAGFGRPQSEAEVRQRIGEGIVGSAAKVKRPVYVRDVTKDPRYI